jgi:hypothetical protein
MVIHPEIALFRGFDENQSVGADAGSPGAHGPDLFVREADKVVAVIDDDEVISGSGHFGELYLHAAFVEKGFIR